MELHQIEVELINACVKQDASLFFETVKQKNITTSFRSKTGFYSFLKYMIESKKNKSTGETLVKTKKKVEDGEIINYYDFFDEYFVNSSRLTVTITEKQDSFELDVFPF